MNLRQPVVLTLIAAIMLVLAGLYFIERQRAVSPSGTGATWNGGSGYVISEDSFTSADTSASPPDISNNTGPDTLVIPPGTSPAAAPVAKSATPDGAFDFNAMLAQMRREGAIYSASKEASSTFNALLDTFSFGPAITVAEEPKKQRSAKEEAIFEYGNRVGRYLQGFAAVNPNMGQTLNDQIKHRDNKAFGDAVRDLGARYKALGESVLAIHDVPPEMEQAHTTLGESYVHLGSALSAVPDATEDQAFLAAITAYNDKADAYTRSFVGMVALFSALNITFEQSDPGSAFSFRR